VVLIELTTGAGETPDAIGWFCGGLFSILIEAKTTRRDFLADARKRFRRSPSQGVGVYRYYLTAPSLISTNELPPYWGLLEINGRRVQVVQPAECQPSDSSAEKQMLWSECRRKQQGG
jgi:hypothetical protein